MKPLHRVLATIILENLTAAWTPENCERYFTKNVLARYSIRRETPVDITDWNKALELAREERRRQERDPSRRSLYLADASYW